MVCQCRFTSYNQGTTSVQDVDTGGGYAYAAANIWEISCAQYFCNLKLLLKNKVYLKKKKEGEKPGECFTNAKLASGAGVNGVKCYWEVR